MFRLLSRIPFLFAGVPLHVRAAVQDTAGGEASESGFMVWVVLVLVLVFGGLGYATWQLMKTERDKQPGNEPPG